MSVGVTTVDLDAVQQVSSEIIASTTESMREEFHVIVGDFNDARKVCALAFEMGWDIGTNDAEVFYAADVNGLFVGKLHDEVVGACRVVKYSKDFGFVGLYLVDSRFQGRGFGSRIWSVALEYLGECATVGLDSVAGKERLYEKVGFQTYYSHVRYQSPVECVTTDKENWRPPTACRMKIVDLADVPCDVLAAYDATVFAACRRHLIRKVASCSDAKAVGLLCPKDGTQLVGYGVVRRLSRGFCIGPLFADTEESAEIIFRRLRAKVPVGEFWCVDIPDCNAAAVRLVEKYNLEIVNVRSRMYSNGPPSAECCDRVYAVTKYRIG